MKNQNKVIFGLIIIMIVESLNAFTEKDFCESLASYSEECMKWSF